MADVDAFTRSYLFVDVHRAATADTVAELFEAAAAKLRHYGEVDVQHIAFEPGDGGTAATTSMTIYYDRVERRREDRQEHVRHPSEATARALRPVD